MDEYERAGNEYIALVSGLNPATYDLILDSNTQDKDCESVKRICFHVLFAGYAFANAIRKKFGMEVSSPERFYPSQSEFPFALSAMIKYTEKALADRYSMKDDELTNTNIPVRWSDHHDLEALLEHAIVHLLRHRRQVEYLTSRSG